MQPLRRVEKGATYDKKLSVRDSYKTFRRNVESKPGYMKCSTYMTILRAISEEIVRELCNGAEVILPSRLGSLQVVKYMPAKRNVDYYNSNMYTKRIPHINSHSDGYCIRVHWDKRELANFKNKNIWGFDLSKDNKSRNKLSLAKTAKRIGTSHFVERNKHKNGKV